MAGVGKAKIDTPSGPVGSVVIVDFTLFGQRFPAMTAGPHHGFNDAISLASPATIRRNSTATGTPCSLTAARRLRATG